MLSLGESRTLVLATERWAKRAVRLVPLWMDSLTPGTSAGTVCWGFGDGVMGMRAATVYMPSLVPRGVRTHGVAIVCYTPDGKWGLVGIPAVRCSPQVNATTNKVSIICCLEFLLANAFD